MDKRFRLNARMNVNIIITNFWVWIARMANTVSEGAIRVSKYAGKHAERRIKRNLHLAKLMEQENYPKTFETQLVSVEKEFGHS